ncbi:unnamed protein product [Leptidea sinapis]|uniref:Uncharacterized protein n=1 Tax=Leptidea sinapis TaxID=189913 RepID=A0A5E4QCW2_9NEOP|nr:unnamed protein product [Leptidea sinapis]
MHILRNTEIDLTNSDQGVENKEARFKWTQKLYIVMLADILIPVMQWRTEEPDLDGITEMLLTVTTTRESDKNINLTPDPNDQASIFFTTTEIDLTNSDQGVENKEARFKWTQKLYIVMLADILIPVMQWRTEEPDLDGITEMLLTVTLPYTLN